jgi:hypothetical protein
LPCSPACECGGPAGLDALGEPAERHLSLDQTFQQWVLDPACSARTAATGWKRARFSARQVETVKLRNVVPPIRFESGVADSAELCRQTGRRARGRAPPRERARALRRPRRLAATVGRAGRVFEDNAGLSRERAGEVAEYFKTALNLPPEAIVIRVGW